MNFFLNMSVHTTLLLIICFGFPCTVLAEKLNIDIHAEAAILIDADTGTVLYEKNPHQQHYPASITKIITAFYALQKASDKLDVMIAADQECIGTVTEAAKKRSNYTLPSYLLTPCGCHIGIKRGEQLSLRDLLYGLMIASGDDAANVIAKYVGGTIPQFMDEVNAYVQSLGCNNTVFCNPHGLHDPKQVTTAYDMAIITKEAMKDPLFREIVSTVRYKRPKTNKQEPTLLIQTNRLLRPGTYYYSKAIGVKTGYYSLACSTFVAAAKDGDRMLIAVLLKEADRKLMFADAKKMFEAAFSQPKVRRVFVKKENQQFAAKFPGTTEPVIAETKEDVALEYYPAEEQPVKCLLYWDKELPLPIAKGQQVGNIALITQEGKVLSKTPLFAKEKVSASWVKGLTTLFYREGSTSFLTKIFVGVLVITFLGLFAFQLLRKKRT